MTAERTILLLEDDPNLGTVLQEHLQMHGFAVILCTDGEAGLEAYRNAPVDLCLVDVMMPRKDGFSFVSEVRSGDPDTPIMFLTAKSMKEDRIQGFRLGADDYITKPFSIEELLLRVEAVLKRSSRGTDTPEQFDIGSYSFDYTRQTLSRGDDRRALTPKESELLRLLCMNVNRTVGREQALRQIWHNDSYFSGRSMDVFISKLRKYFKDDPSVEIMGIHGKGFRLVATEP
jgi:DNA-binding response OmpR family regulator